MGSFCVPPIFLISALVFLKTQLLQGSSLWGEYSYMTLDSTEFAVSQEIYIEFTRSFNGTTSAGDTIQIALPRFTSGDGYGTDGSNIANVHLAPSRYFTGVWYEGTFTHDSPYNQSYLELTLREPLPLTEVTLYIFRSNGLKVYCGFPANWNEFKLTMASVGVDETLSETPSMGNLCEALNYCSQRGTCDYCNNVCLCWDGSGSEDDVKDFDVQADCSTVLCKHERAVRVMPRDASNSAHNVNLECAGNGFCNRDEYMCECSLGFEGEGCQRRQCPQACSGHGKCMSMETLALQEDAMPLSSVTPVYGSVDTQDTSTWDADIMYGCLCDSSWEVGLGANQTQQSEWFGPDCSLRRCPTGDDPRTEEDETDCEGVEAEGGLGVGEAGNLCHVDCSNRGLCNFVTGQCSCFRGYYGDNCSKMHVLAGINE
mmetsp:Transcript_19018/g.25060  ORF Transcript_19018/g.25060 Transcript_19018/m.25060 type:complete len:428 (+) Transcript_19018:162-1445(+)|eukprot:CAMPEP_0117740768 /NCGR_PEP_ID=MMETSP0947-20121206/4531_1 /TAXON_ID=44440 /ORGANISM="Chattonella subsalsa, Strain CCMP2191" /LENGTH=427 /DNA_ID=CAMNT_0005556931 /DNA_START=75 /DNA_END=1358 /DNA_ORIENTATION=+